MSTFTIDSATSRATPTPVPGKRMTVPAIRGRKTAEGNGYKTEQPIVMLTAYTMRMAQLLDPHCEVLLVGDSLGQVIYGLPSTVPMTGMPRWVRKSMVSAIASPPSSFTAAQPVSFMIREALAKAWSGEPS